MGVDLRIASNFMDLHQSETDAQKLKELINQETKCSPSNCVSHFFMNSIIEYHEYFPNNKNPKPSALYQIGQMLSVDFNFLYEMYEEGAGTFDNPRDEEQRLIEKNLEGIPKNSPIWELGYQQIQIEVKQKQQLVGAWADQAPKNIDIVIPYFEDILKKIEAKPSFHDQLDVKYSFMKEDEYLAYFRDELPLIAHRKLSFKKDMEFFLEHAKCLKSIGATKMFYIIG